MKRSLLKYYLEGMSCVFAFGGISQISREVVCVQDIEIGTFEDDARAMERDWQKVGNDLKNVISKQTSKVLAPN